MISDHTFDDWARELIELQKKYPEIARKCCYHDYFKDFEGSGFGLPLWDNWGARKALVILDYHACQKKDGN